MILTVLRELTSMDQELFPNESQTRLKGYMAKSEMTD
jgi:hypothetical protein